MGAFYAGQIGSQTPTAGQDVADILQQWGELERARQERQLTNTILQGIASGKDFQQVIAEALQQQNPSYAGGLAGGFQRFSGMFAPPSSETMRILGGMGLAQMTPQAQAQLEGTKALTQQRRTATKATKQGMKRAKAHEQLDVEAAQTDLSKSRQQLAELERANDPAFQEYDHYNRLAVMSLNRLRYGDIVTGDPEYDEAMQQYNGALRQMQDAWQRYENRSGTTAPGEAATQGVEAQAGELRPNVDDAVAWSLADPQRAQAYWSDVLSKQGYDDRDIQEFSQILATGDRARIQAALNRIGIE